ncbi:hypothetical protein OF83DRAFT_1148721 [Amylostereum chailletii]|nr:hypothetical protein OF83DRAFT_1148721 [Amylostereum chailletii]
MPKRVGTPPPAEDEPKYLVVVNPYPLRANMELEKDRQDFALWLACCTGKEPLCALFHKPASPSMIIIEVDRDFDNFPGLLGEHKWADFLRQPTEEQAGQSSKIFYCVWNTGRKVEKNGWKRVFIKESWFQGWHPNNHVIRYLYPETSYCDLPIEEKTANPLCRPLPVKYFPPPSKAPAPPVGSAQWYDAKAKGTLPEYTPAIKPRSNANGPWMNKKKKKPTVAKFPLPDSYTSGEAPSTVPSRAPSSKAWNDVPLGVHSPSSGMSTASSNGGSTSVRNGNGSSSGLASPSVPPGLSRLPTTPLVPPGLGSVPLRAPVPVLPQGGRMTWSEEMDYEDDLHIGHDEDEGDEGEGNEDEGDDDADDNFSDDGSESVQIELGSQVNGGAFYGYRDATANKKEGWGRLTGPQEPLPRRIVRDKDTASSQSGSARTWGRQTSYDPWTAPAASPPPPSPPPPAEEEDSDSEAERMPKAQSVRSWGAQTEHHPWGNPLPRYAEVPKDDASAVEHQDLWQGWQDPKPEKILPGKVLCHEHGIVCKKGICKWYAKQLKEERQREERRVQEKERRQRQEKRERQAAAKEKREMEAGKEKEKAKQEKEKAKNTSGDNRKKSNVADGPSTTSSTQESNSWAAATPSSSLPAPIEDWSHAAANTDWGLGMNDDDAVSVASTDRFAWSSAASVRSAGSAGSARSNNTVTSQSGRSIASRAPTASSSGGWDRGSTPWDPLPSNPPPTKPAVPQGVWGARAQAPPRAQTTQSQVPGPRTGNQQQRSQTTPQGAGSSYGPRPPPPPSASEQRSAPSVVSSGVWDDASAEPW